MRCRKFDLRLGICHRVGLLDRTHHVDVVLSVAKGDRLRRGHAVVLTEELHRAALAHIACHDLAKDVTRAHGRQVREALRHHLLCLEDVLWLAHQQELVHTTLAKLTG